MRGWERRNPGYKLLCEWRALDPLGVVWHQRCWERDLGLMLQFLGPREKLAAFKMALDNFKQVNDSLGHSSSGSSWSVHGTVRRAFGLRAVGRRPGDPLLAAVESELADEPPAGRQTEELRTSPRALPSPACGRTIASIGDAKFHHLLERDSKPPRPCEHGPLHKPGGCHEKLHNTTGSLTDGFLSRRRRAGGNLTRSEQ